MIRSFFKSTIALPVMLLVSSGFSIVLLMIRMCFSFHLLFLFLCWNLFLAWIPLILSLRLNIGQHKKFSGWSVTLLLLWFLFFPNAPYLITDLIHLRSRPPIPEWFDMVLLISFAWNGLMLGMVSLFEIKKFLSSRLLPVVVELIMIAVISISSFGIYLGRFLRWNSWDIFFNSSDLASDITTHVIHVRTYPQAFMVTLLLAVFQSIIYFTYNAIKNENKLIETKN